MYINTHLSANIGVKIIHCTQKDSPVSDNYQFYLIQKGSVLVQLKNEKFTLIKDDVIMIPPEEKPFISPITKNSLVGIRIDRMYIENLIPFGYSLVCNSVADSKATYDELAKILLDMCSTFYSLGNQEKMTSLFYLFADCIKKNHLHHNDETKSTDQININRINQIKDLVNANYDRPFSLSVLADKMYLTPQYLSKFIKKHLGISFSKYLIKIRLAHAYIELIQTDNPITNIALNNGFQNASTFNKVFKDVYGMPPTIYKQKNKPNYDIKKEECNPEQENFEDKKFRSISLNACNVQSYNKPWSDTINIGNISNALSSDFQEYFEIYREKIPVKYVRFDNILSISFIKYHNESDSFDFSNLNEVLSYFYRLKCYPFINLLLKNKIDSSPKFNPMLKPFEPENNDINYQCKVLRALMKYSIQVYGNDYVSKWRFEITAPHDEYLRYSESHNEYINKYSAFYSVIKELSPSSKVGGPDFNMCADINIFKNFIDSFSEKKLSIDFISFSAYSYETSNSITTDDPLSQGIVSSDKDYILNCFKRYKSIIMLSQYHNIPV